MTRDRLLSIPLVRNLPVLQRILGLDRLPVNLPMQRNFLSEDEALRRAIAASKVETHHSNSQEDEDLQAAIAQSLQTSDNQQARILGLDQPPVNPVMPHYSEDEALQRAEAQSMIDYFLSILPVEEYQSIDEALGKNPNLVHEAFLSFLTDTQRVDLIKALYRTGNNRAGDMFVRFNQ